MVWRYLQMRVFWWSPLRTKGACIAFGWEGPKVTLAMLYMLTRCLV